MDPTPDPCINHFEEVVCFWLLKLANCVPFNLSLKLRRRARFINDEYSTSVDSALENFSQLRGDNSSIRVGLEFIQTFLTVIDYDFKQRHGDLVSSIEDAFEKEGLELEYAIQKGDAARVLRVRSNLLRSIELFKPRIREAYDGVAIEDDVTFPWPPITRHSGGWDRLCGFLVRNASSLFINNSKTSSPAPAPVLMLIREVVSGIQVFGKASLKDEFLRDDLERLLRRVRVHVKRVAFCLSRILFLWWVDETEDEHKAIMLSDLLMEIMPSSPEILDMFLNVIPCRYHRDCPEHVLVDSLVDHMVLLSSSSGSSGEGEEEEEEENGSLSTFRNVLRSLVKYLVDGIDPEGWQWESQSVQSEIKKQLRSDVKKLVCDAASLKYSSIKFKLAHLQCIPKIELLKVEIVLTELRANNSILKKNLESIYKGLSLLQTSCLVDHVNSSSSEKMVLIYDRIEQVVREAQHLHFLLLLPVCAKSQNRGLLESAYIHVRRLMSEAGRADFSNWIEFLVNKIKDKHCDALKLKLVLDFKLLKIQALLMDQMRRRPSLLVHVKDKIHSLYERLEFLFKYFSVLSLENPGHEDLISSCIDIVAKKETVLCNFFESDQVSEQIINQMSVFVSNLMKKVNLPVSDFEVTYLQFQSSIVLTLPKTHLGLAFLDLFLDKLSGLLKYKADSIGYSLRHRIEAVLIKDLDSIRSFLDEVEEKRNQNQELKDLRRRVTQAAYQADYVIDLILQENYDWCHVLWIFNFMDEIKAIKSELMKIVQMKNEYFTHVHDASQTSEHEMITQTSTPEFGTKVVVSLDDQEEIIINRLTRGTFQRREVVTIFGMPGIGKTTLAKKLYDNPRVSKYFHKLAWGCVSQVYRKRELLLKILSDITESTTNEIHNKSDQDLIEMLYKGLKGKRYLVVMDDVWGTEAWEELGSAFPDDSNGSRILFTSRSEKVALKAQNDSVPHPLRFLTEDESWKLLQESIFDAEDKCPEELKGVGGTIAERCKGLPLAVVAVAGILKRTERKAEGWKQIEEDLDSRILEDPESQCMHILELSYNHLPDDLKPCFLYFAAFGEDNEVPVQKLIQLWTAEGFVRKVDQKASLEDVAESYIMDLIGRSLLMAARRGSDGRVKACKVHDMLYNLCLRKVEEDNFLQYINGYEKHFPSSNNRLDYGLDSVYPQISVAYEQHRLSICSKRNHFAMLKPSGPSVRTLLFSATSDSNAACPYDNVLLFITDKFKLLRVLGIESINIGSSFPEGIELLDSLRYLAISGNIKSVPSKLAKLWNLETFIVKGLMGKVALPDTIWSMSSLRHLHVSTQAIFSLPGSSQMDNMVTLSWPVLSNGDDSEEMMKLFPNLRKLRCTFSGPAQHSEKSISFPVLDFLKELESLKVIYNGSVHHYCHLKGLSFPLNLKKLSLSDFSLKWDEFSAIGEIPNLKVLKLVSIAFDSPIWDMKDGEFQELEYLKLDSLKIEEWNASSDHLQNLQQLVLRSCTRLQEVPLDFGEITTLQMIEVKWCSSSAENSVREIQEQQLEYGNNGFKAFINVSPADFRSSV